MSLSGTKVATGAAEPDSTLRPARADDLLGIKTLLQTAGLPLDGLDDPQTELFVLQRGGEILGVVGWESYPPLALLRSLAVVPGQRGRGTGRRLFDYILAEAKTQGFTAVYGLTTTIPDWLERLGFTELSAGDLPGALGASAELQGACPTTARAFLKAM